MREVVYELYAVAHARGVRLAPETAEAYVTLLFEKLIPPPRRTMRACARISSSAGGRRSMR